MRIQWAAGEVARPVLRSLGEVGRVDGGPVCYKTNRQKHHPHSLSRTDKRRKSNVGRRWSSIKLPPLVVASLLDSPEVE